ncbi:MAG: aminoacetone oxidase family FAD-binding enzyme, partial [Ruminococcus sp.]|nr:aminoacetone oxidase family FAD-binding enzyme [Ruminococcus sp.]
MPVFDVIIAGGGASGLMCAARCAQKGLSCAVVEKNKRCGVKLSITGKGRCNVTNNSDNDNILRNIPRNPRFMYSALERFSSNDTMAFFEKLGVPLKTERGNRVFPVSDKASDIVDALVNECKRQGVQFINDEVLSVLTENGRAVGLVCKNGSCKAENVILACGGRSYPKTGSNGSGYEIAKKLGHTVTEIGPSLCPIECTEHEECADSMGLSLRNCTLSLYSEGKKKPVYSELGELIFTHFGLSGPLVLSASAHMGDLKKNNYTLSIDLKPALDEGTLDKRIVRDFTDLANTEMSNALRKLLPQK